jgi:hypothetical protein
LIKQPRLIGRQGTTGYGPGNRAACPELKSAAGIGFCGFLLDAPPRRRRICRENDVFGAKQSIFERKQGYHEEVDDHHEQVESHPGIMESHSRMMNDWQAAGVTTL